MESISGEGADSGHTDGRKNWITIPRGRFRE